MPRPFAFPGLGDLPIVGPWFSNNTIETIETETVVLVTPELVSPLEKNEVTEAPGDRVYQPNDPEFYLLGRIEGKLGREFRATEGRARPAQPDEAFSERAAVGDRPARPRRLIVELARRCRIDRETWEVSMDRTVIRFAPVVVDRWNRCCWLRRRRGPRRRWIPPIAPPVCNRRGRLHRMFHHTAHTASRQVVGYPETFRRAAAGLLRQRTVHRAGRQGRPASVHALPQRFPAGHKPVLADRGIAVQHHGDTDARLARPDHDRMDSRAARAGGVATPGDRGDADRQAGQPILADRVVIAPSPYPGAMGVEAANNICNTITRSQMSAPAFTLPPTESASMGVR